MIPLICLKQGFDAAVQQIQNDIAANGGPQSNNFKSEGAPSYNLFTHNCGNVANNLASAAGATTNSTTWRPNAQFRQERVGTLRNTQTTNGGRNVGLYGLATRK